MWKRCGKVEGFWMKNWGEGSHKEKKFGWFWVPFSGSAVRVIWMDGMVYAIKKEFLLWQWPGVGLGLWAGS